MSRTYSPSSYDDNFCLKPPGLLWLAVLYLSRAFLLVVIYVVSSVSRVSPEALATLRGTVSVYAFVPSLVAARGRRLRRSAPPVSRTRWPAIPETRRQPRSRSAGHACPRGVPPTCGGWDLARESLPAATDAHRAATRPRPQRPLEPNAYGDSEALLGASTDLRGDETAQDLAQHDLAGARAYPPLERQSPGELEQLGVEERRPGLEAHRHRGTIDFRQEVTWQDVECVEKHHGLRRGE